MKKVFYLCMLVCTGLIFSCGGSTSNTANTADSTIVTDSTAGAMPPAPEQSTDQSSAATPAQPSSSAPAQSSSSSASDDDNTPSTAAAATPEVTYQKFYDELSPDGSWINYPNQGYVWAPKVDQDFEPYSTNGHWVYSNDGWTWASDYKWGWAAFHYGRWFQDSKRGWLWKPGNEWGPAWVKWSQSNDNYGWAPLGVGISVSANWNPPASSWNFVPKQYINKPDVRKYVVAKTQNTTIVKNVTVINNVTNVTNNKNTTVINNNSNNKTINNNKKTTVNSKTVNNTKTVNNNITVKGNNNTVINKGPQVTDVEKVTKTKVQQVNIADDNKPGAPSVKNNRLVVYRPVVKADAKVKAAPKNIERPVAPAKPVVAKPAPKKGKAKNP